MGREYRLAGNTHLKEIPMGFYQNDATAANNTSINGTAMAGSSTPANIDNAIRELAAQGKQFAKDLGGPTAGGSADSLTVTLNDTALTAYYDGLLFGCIIANDSTSTAPQINVNSIGAKTIYKASAGVEAALASGDMQGGQYVIFRYRSAWGGTGGFELIRFDADLPQSLATTSAPTFADLTITDDLTVGDDLLMSAGSVMNWNSGAITITDQTTQLYGFGGAFVWANDNGASSPAARYFNIVDGASVATASFDGDRATPADGDAQYVDYRLSDSVGTQTVFLREIVTAVDVTNATEDGRVEWQLPKAGTLATRATLDPVTGLTLAVPFSRGVPVTKTGNFTVADTENWIIINDSGECTVTLPSAATYPGREIMFKSITANGVISASSNVVGLTSEVAGDTICNADDGAYATLVSDGTNWIRMQATL
jgi:hypothetical protein